MQMWAFEAIPFLGSLYARKADGEVRLPQFFNCRSTDTMPSYDRVVAASTDSRVCIIILAHCYLFLTLFYIL